MTSTNETSDHSAINDHAIVISRSETNRSPFLKINNHGDVYIVSIIATNSSTKKKWNTIVINGWEALKHKRTRFKCCYRWTNGKTIASLANKTIYKDQTHLRALQYRCPFGGDREHLKGVAIEFYIRRCPKEDTRYQQPYFPVLRGDNSVALCAKIVYGNISNKLLVDWMEYYREMKVSKIVMFTYNLEEVTRRILRYYEELGFLQTFEFDFPWKVSGR